MKTRSYILVVLLSIFTYLSANGENYIHTQILKKLQQYETSKPESVPHIANKLMDLFAEVGLVSEIIPFSPTTGDSIISQQVYYWAAEYFYEIQKYKDALHYGLKGAPFCKNSDFEADCFNIISLASFRISDYETAIKYAKLCYELDEKSGDYDLMSSSLNTIAGIYLGANLPQEGEKYILKALEAAAHTDNPKRRSVIHGMASEIFHAQGKEKEALEHIEEACLIEEKLGREEKLLVRLVQKASVLVGCNRWNEAEHILEKIIPDLEKSGNIQSLGIACNKMGVALLGQGEEVEALQYFKKGAAIFSQTGDLRNEMHSRKGLYESYWKISPDSAKIELEKFNSLKDSLYNSASAESLARYSAEFESMWLKVENSRQKKIICYLILFSLLLVAVLASIYSYRRFFIKLKDNRLVSPDDEYPHLNQQNRLFIRQMIEIILHKMSEKDFSVETLASGMCLSRGHLNRKVKNLTGITTQQYVLRVRMEYAKKILQTNPDESIFNISCMCGFDDLSSFSRAFKRIYGKTPSQIRQQEL